MEQLLRWASFASYDVDKVAKFGLPVKVEPFYKDEDVLWGITLSIIRDGEAATEIGIRFDNEENEKHEWVGRGSDGFPTLEGKKVSVVGKHLEIRLAASHQPDVSPTCNFCYHTRSWPVMHGGFSTICGIASHCLSLACLSAGSWMTGPLMRKCAVASGTSARTWLQRSTNTMRLALPLQTRPPDGILRAGAMCCNPLRKAFMQSCTWCSGHSP